MASTIREALRERMVRRAEHTKGATRDEALRLIKALDEGRTVRVSRERLGSAMDASGIVAWDTRLIKDGEHALYELHPDDTVVPV